MTDKATKFWAFYYHILSAMQKGLTLAEASVKYTGESLEAANYFDNYIKTGKA
jgi:hypothetical protein